MDRHDGFTLTVYSNRLDGFADRGMIFDSSNWTGNDDDLQTPSVSGIGNAADESLGKLLIISTDGNSADPNDDPLGGSLIFDFSESSYAVDSFGFHLVDAETDNSGSEKFFVKLFNGNSETGYLSLQGDNVAYGNNSINEFSPFLASSYNWSGFTKAEVKFLGSGAIDNIALSAAPVPEPATMLLFGSGLLGLAGIGRRKLAA